MEYEQIMKKLKDISNTEDGCEEMARLNIQTEGSLGISIKDLRKIAKGIEKDHNLAQKLWDSGTREARIMASMVDKPKKVTEKQMEDWVEDFNSWDLCDQVCNNLFRRTDYAEKKAIEWSQRDREFVKRAGFTLMATMAVHEEDNERMFLDFLERCRKEACDERKYVKKAISWAIRNIGKRNKKMKGKVIALAEELKDSDSKSARWIASDILRKINK